MQFEGNTHLQKYEEPDGSIAYRQANTVKQLVSIRNYMILLLNLLIRSITPFIFS